MDFGLEIRKYLSGILTTPRGVSGSRNSARSNFIFAFFASAYRVPRTAYRVPRTAYREPGEPGAHEYIITKIYFLHFCTGEPPFGEPPFGEPPFGEPPFGEPPFGVNQLTYLKMTINQRIALQERADKKVMELATELAALTINGCWPQSGDQFYTALAIVGQLEALDKSLLAPPVAKVVENWLQEAQQEGIWVV